MPIKKITATSTAGSERVRIRIYRHGLGDCFLLRFPGPAGKPFHLVIDSGVIKGTSNPTVIMREVAEDIRKETGGKIDALVVTHEHWDHVSGFTEAREVWAGMQIAEVWLGWTEDPKEPIATKLRKDREARKAMIKTAIAALADGSSLRLDSARSGRLDAILGFMGFGLALDDDAVGGTKGALDFIAGQAKKQPPLYHSPGTSFVRKEIPGVRIYVLGPPKDEKKIKKSDPSAAHPEVYEESGDAFGFSGNGNSGMDQDWERPFADCVGKTARTPQDYDTLFEKHFSGLLPTPTAAGGPQRDPDWRRLGYESFADLERLALALDGDTNNTSLALAFELDDGRVLLFPADAQVGNWLSWQDHAWKVGIDSIRADDLLKRTVFYKVGHHGSHNATLKADGLEKMSHRDLIAVVPVNKAMAKKKRWNMPFPPLYTRLKEKARGRVILADASEPLPKAVDLTALTATERKRYESMVTASELFIDITL